MEGEFLPVEMIRQGPDGINSTNDAIKKALVRQPPEQFIVEMLAPSKSPSNSDGYTFDMRITPLSVFLTSSSSSSSSSSEASTAHASVTYVIHRTWEDCLFFQAELELAYTTRSRQKKSRLKSGKGLKSTSGVYKRSDGASSWESLPYGPAPSTISIDLHTYLPTLTKRGTFFKPSQKTIDTRYRELKGFVSALFGGDEDSMPVLLKELRSERVVTDFFGVWRRDWSIGVKRGEIVDTTVNRGWGGLSVGSRRRATSSASSSSGSSGSRNSMSTISEFSSIAPSISPSTIRTPPSPQPTMTKQRPPSSYRESWQTTDSASTFLYGLGFDLPKEKGSRLSVATFMTDVSSEAVLQAEPELYRDEDDEVVYQHDSSSESDNGGSDLKRSHASKKRQHRSMSILSAANTIRPPIVFSEDSEDLDEMPQTARRESFDLDSIRSRDSYVRRPDSGISLGLPDFHLSDDTTSPEWDVPDTPRPLSSFFIPRSRDSISTKRDTLQSVDSTQRDTKRDTFQSVASVELSSFPRPPSMIPPTPIRLISAASNLNMIPPPTPLSPFSAGSEGMEGYMGEQQYAALLDREQQREEQGGMVTVKAMMEYPTVLTVVLKVSKEASYEEVRDRIHVKVDSVLDRPSSSPTSPSPVMKQKLGENFGIVWNGRMVASDKDWKIVVGGESEKVVVKILDTLS